MKYQITVNTKFGAAKLSSNQGYEIKHFTYFYGSRHGRHVTEGQLDFVLYIRVLTSPIFRAWEMSEFAAPFFKEYRNFCKINFTRFNTKSVGSGKTYPLTKFILHFVSLND